MDFVLLFLYFSRSFLKRNRTNELSCQNQSLSSRITLGDIVMDQHILEKYAELIVRSGIALQKGQSVIIRTNVNQEAFASLVAEECYKAGAKRVSFQWQSAVMDSLDFRYADAAELGRSLPQNIGFQRYCTEEL